MQTAFLLIDGVFEAFTSTELRHLGSLDLDALSGARIAAGACGALAT